jgi:hypothetical protein
MFQALKGAPLPVLNELSLSRSIDNNTEILFGKQGAEDIASLTKIFVTVSAAHAKGKQYCASRARHLLESGHYFGITHCKAIQRHWLVGNTLFRRQPLSSLAFNCCTAYATRYNPAGACEEQLFLDLDHTLLRSWELREVLDWDTGNAAAARFWKKYETNGDLVQVLSVLRMMATWVDEPTNLGPLNVEVDGR